MLRRYLVANARGLDPAQLIGNDQKYEKRDGKTDAKGQGLNGFVATTTVTHEIKQCRPETDQD